MNEHPVRQAPAFENLRVGDDLPGLVRGPMTPVHLMRWSASIENWHRIHYDEQFARQHDGLEGLLINGSWKQHFLVQMMDGWLAPSGWLVHIGFQFRKMNLVGEILTAWGRVSSLEVSEGVGLVTCQIGILNERGEESTPGTAIVALPLRQGESVPYPYPSPAELRGR